MSSPRSIRVCKIVITCACGAEVTIGHPDRGVSICTTCRRYWTPHIEVTSQHEHEIDPQTTIRGMAAVIREIESHVNGLVIDDIIERHGVGSALDAIDQETAL